jgi:predicted metalloendopeptidase
MRGSAIGRDMGHAFDNRGRFADDGATRDSWITAG